MHLVPIPSLDPNLSVCTVAWSHPTLLPPPNITEAHFVLKLVPNLLLLVQQNRQLQLHLSIPHRWVCLTLLQHAVVLMQRWYYWSSIGSKSIPGFLVFFPRSDTKWSISSFPLLPFGRGDRLGREHKLWQWKWSLDESRGLHTIGAQ